MEIIFTLTLFFIKAPAKSFTGNSPSISVRTLVDGGVEFYPIQGDMLRSVHDKPQVNNTKKNTFSLDNMLNL